MLSAELLKFVRRCAAMDDLTDDATEVYLFSNSEEMLNAVTRDRSSANLPLLRGPWDFQKEIVLARTLRCGYRPRTSAARHALRWIFYLEVTPHRTNPSAAANDARAWASA
ncbi:hypothetical protein HYPDE_33238 [Hyphomicrobium denitrificans 1NES1]|uniref:Uncharacterized protein n=1 Tax=Hyphomicrobium denitrificans 1NES1 TaxID=670307 RepID=N0BDW5_9HYPH|nr:hypothetical protein HYPDE_33238 [Hyphomicrobium denitrificans 1NES1]